MNTRIKRLSAINYFGGKSRHLDWILPLIPSHHTYLECFFGSGAVFFNKEPAAVECISDLDGRLINFFKVLRDKGNELLYKLEMTPYARGEFQEAGETSKDPVEDARRFFVRAVQSFGGITHNTRRANSYRIDVQETRRGIAACVSKFLSKIENLAEVVDRLRCTEIDNRSAFYLIPKFNFPDAFLYLDPPYNHEIRTANNDYKYEFFREDHFKLAILANESKAMIMISHYDDPFYDSLYPASKWIKHYGPIRQSNLGRSSLLKDNSRRECVWMNYKT